MEYIYHGLFILPSSTSFILSLSPLSFLLSLSSYIRDRGIYIIVNIYIYTFIYSSFFLSSIYSLSSLLPSFPSFILLSLSLSPSFFLSLYRYLLLYPIGMNMNILWFIYSILSLSFILSPSFFLSLSLSLLPLSLSPSLSSYRYLYS